MIDDLGLSVDAFIGQLLNPESPFTRLIGPPWRDQSHYHSAMCGRYVMRKLRWADYQAQPGFEEFSETRIVPRFNVAPSQAVPIVRQDSTGRRVGELLRWGLIPYWTQGPPKQQPINARAESVATGAMFRSAFEQRRCLQVADGFYEWQRGGEEKQPYLIRLASDAAFAFAGLFERWRPDAETEPVETCCHITTEPNEVMRAIHTRMPAILLPEQYDAWLDPRTPRAQLQAMLQPLPDGLLEAYPVSRAVNSTRQDSPENIVPIRLDVGKPQLELPFG